MRYSIKDCLLISLEYEKSNFLQMAFTIKDKKNIFFTHDNVEIKTSSLIYFN